MVDFKITNNIFKDSNLFNGHKHHSSSFCIALKSETNDAENDVVEFSMTKNKCYYKK